MRGLPVFFLVLCSGRIQRPDARLAFLGRDLRHLGRPAARLLESLDKFAERQAAAGLENLFTFISGEDAVPAVRRPPLSTLELVTFTCSPPYPPLTSPVLAAAST